MKLGNLLLPIVVALLLGGTLLSHGAGHEHEVDAYMWSTALFLTLVLVAHVGRNSVPSVLALVVLGWAAQDYEPFLSMREHAGFSAFVITVAVVLVIFEEGLSTQLDSYRRQMLPIIVLAVPGCLLTAYFFAMMTNSLLGIVPVMAVAFGLGVGATDPASVIGLLHGKPLKRSLLDLLKGEAICNDVVVAVTATILKGMIVLGAVAGGVSGIFGGLLGPDGLWLLAKQIAIGCGTGYIGFIVLDMLLGKDDSNLRTIFRLMPKLEGVVSDVRTKLESHGSTAKQGLFLLIPIVLYGMTDKIGGSGLLAVFIAGLVFRAYEHAGKAEVAMHGTMNVYVVPLLFFCLGIRIDAHSMASFFGLGVAATAMIVVARCLAISATLVPMNWLLRRKAAKNGAVGEQDNLTVWDYVFLTLAAPRGAVTGMFLTLFLVAGHIDERTFSIAMWTVLLLLGLTVVTVRIAHRLPGVIRTGETKHEQHRETDALAA